MQGNGCLMQGVSKSLTVSTRWVSNHSMQYPIKFPTNVYVQIFIFWKLTEWYRFVTYLWNDRRIYKYQTTLVVYFETAGLLIGLTHLCNVFDFATSCNYVMLSLSMHTGCPMHIRFCAIISSIFYVCDVIVVKICPYKVANLQLWSENFKWNWVYLCSQPSDVTMGRPTNPTCTH